MLLVGNMKHIGNLYKKNEYVRYTIWFLLCMAVILFPFALRGKSLIKHGDAFNQYYPVFVYIGQWLRACLHGEIRLFDFRIGLGDDVIHALNYHGFGDITQLVSIAFPYKYSEYAYDLVMVLKLWLTGISFLIYIKRYVQHKEYRIVGALLYACNTYAFAWGLYCWTFLAPLMTFPLILSGIDMVCDREKKVSGALLIGLLIQALNGFYFLYMETVMAIIYFVIKEFVIFREARQGEYLKNVISDGVKILGQALLAVSMGAPLLIPSVMGYFQSSRTEREGIVSGIWDMFHYPFDHYRSMLSNLLIPNMTRNILTLGYLIILGILIGFIYRADKGKVHRYMLLLFVFLYCIPLWGNVMNGLAGNSDRWLFGFILIIISVACIGLDMKIILSKKDKLAFYVLVFLMIVLFLADSDWYVGKIIPVICYGIIGIFLPLAWNQRVRYSKLVIPFCVSLIIINGLLVFVPRSIGGSGYIGGFKGGGQTQWEVNQQIDSIKGTGEVFERWDVSVTCLGSSLIKNYYGTTEYLSTLNGRISEFYQELYISPGIFGATWVLKGLDERTELEALLSVSQEEYLPLGISYRSWISREQFDSLNPMEKEAALIKYAVLEKDASDATIIRECSGMDSDILDGNDEIAYSLDKQNIVQDEKRFKTQNDARIRVYLEDFNVDNELYIQLQDMCVYDEGTADILVGNKEIQLRNAADSYYMGVDEFWINVTEWQSDQRGIYFDICLPEGRDFSLEKLNVYQHQINYSAIEERKENSLEQLEIGINKIYGKAYCGEPVLMLFSIPYSEGWSAYVDGEKQSIYKADVGFLAIELGEGNHEVMLKYMTPGLIPGCMCAVVSALTLIGMGLKKGLFSSTKEKNIRNS